MKIQKKMKSMKLMKTALHQRRWKRDTKEKFRLTRGWYIVLFIVNFYAVIPDFKLRNFVDKPDLLGMSIFTS